MKKASAKLNEPDPPNIAPKWVLIVYILLIIFISSRHVIRFLLEVFWPPHSVWPRSCLICPCFIKIQLTLIIYWSCERAQELISYNYSLSLEEQMHSSQWTAKCEVNTLGTKIADIQWWLQWASLMAGKSILRSVHLV